MMNKLKIIGASRQPHLPEISARIGRHRRRFGDLVDGYVGHGGFVSAGQQEDYFSSLLLVCAVQRFNAVMESAVQKD